MAATLLATPTVTPTARGLLEEGVHCSIGGVYFTELEEGMHLSRRMVYFNWRRGSISAGGGGEFEQE